MVRPQKRPALLVEKLLSNAPPHDDRDFAPQASGWHSNAEIALKLKIPNEDVLKYYRPDDRVVERKKFAYMDDKQVPREKFFYRIKPGKAAYRFLMKAAHNDGKIGEFLSSDYFLRNTPHFLHDAKVFEEALRAQVLGPYRTEQRTPKDGEELGSTEDRTAVEALDQYVPLVMGWPELFFLSFDDKKEELTRELTKMQAIFRTGDVLIAFLYANGVFEKIKAKTAVVELEEDFSDMDDYLTSLWGTILETLEDVKIQAKAREKMTKHKREIDDLFFAHKPEKGDMLPLALTVVVKDIGHKNIPYLKRRAATYGKEIKKQEGGASKHRKKEGN